jgi:mannosyltransferase
VRAARRGVETPLICVAAGATAAVLGLITLGRRSLWIDEAIDINLRGLSWGDYIHIAFHREGSQALYLLFLKPWLDLTSTSEWVARTPSVAFAAAAAALLVALGIRLFGSHMVGLGAGLLLATNAFVVSWSQQVRTYTLAMLFAVVVTYLFVLALESGSWRRWLIYGAAAGASVYAHFFVGLVLASHVLAVATTRERATVRRWAAAAGIGLVIALPAFDFALRHDKGQVSWIPAVTYDYLQSVVHDVSGKSWLLLGVAFAGLLALVFAATSGRRDSWRYVLVASWLVLPVVLTLVISYFKPMLVDRYLIVSVPALALAASYAISRLGRLAGAVVLAILVLIGLVHVRDWYRSPVTENWRGAVAYAMRAHPAEQMLVYPGWMGDPAVYYAGSAADLSETFTRDRARVIALVNDAQAVQDWLSSAGYRVVDRTNFGAIDVWRVSRAPTG